MSNHRSPGQQTDKAFRVTATFGQVWRATPRAVAPPQQPPEYDEAVRIFSIAIEDRENFEVVDKKLRGLLSPEQAELISEQIDRMMTAAVENGSLIIGWSSTNDVCRRRGFPALSMSDYRALSEGAWFQLGAIHLLASSASAV